PVHRVLGRPPEHRRCPLERSAGSAFPCRSIRGRSAWHSERRSATTPGTCPREAGREGGRTGVDMYLNAAVLALVAAAYALLSGRVERSRVSGPILFVLAGLLLGPALLGTLALDA